MPKTIDSQIIKDLREFKQLSQEALGQSIGIGKQSISDWERGASKVPLKHRITIIEVFEDINARFILTGKGNIADMEPGQVSEPEIAYRNRPSELLLDEKDKRIKELKEMISELKENKEMITERMKKQADMIEFLRNELIRLGHDDVARFSKAHSA